jgi:hypothetical protein
MNKAGVDTENFNEVLAVKELFNLMNKEPASILSESGGWAQGSPWTNKYLVH